MEEEEETCGLMSETDHLLAGNRVLKKRVKSSEAELNSKQEYQKEKENWCLESRLW